MQVELIKSQRSNLSIELQIIVDKIISQIRITDADALVLYNQASVSLLGMLADLVRKRLHQTNTFFIRNIHIEPTNECVFDCLFCSYRSKNKEDAWEINATDIIKKLAEYPVDEINEVHIVGGAHPKHTIQYYCDMLALIRTNFLAIHIKAFSAIEIIHICKISEISYHEGLSLLKAAGLNSIPGGGAEIFDETIRKQICPGKANADEWLNLHETAHALNISTNATILYGHMETIEHRIEHLNRLRDLQDRSHGFKAFIPLKYKSKNNKMDTLKEVSVIDDLKTFALSRIYLDNFPHVKAYWPMLGKNTTQLLLSFGVDDMDGTINDSTKIYSRAGAEESNPAMTPDEMQRLIEQAGFTAVERTINTKY